MNAVLSESPDPVSATGRLAVDNVSLVRGKRRVLDGVSVTARAGRLLALVGPNGAGKSSLLSLMAGLIAPTRGRVTLDGRALDDWPARALATRRAMLSQHVHASFGFCALEVVLLGRSPHARGDAAVRERDLHIAEAALRATRAAHLRDRNCLQLSGGEQRRVQLARVLAQIWEPPAGHCAWLLLDEPEASLDIAQQHFMLQLARDFAERGFGVVAVLHDLNLALSYADDVALMCDGRLLRQGTANHALEPQILSEVYGIGMLRTATDANGRHWIVAADT